MFSGCGKQTEPDNTQPPLETAAYFNLTDGESRDLRLELLPDAGIEETRIDILLDRVDQFNASVKSEWLTKGFESAAPTDTRYDPYEMQDLWTEKNGSFPGYNCRITAFSLFSEFVTVGTGQPETQGEDSLFLDLETLTAIPPFSAGTVPLSSVRCSHRWPPRTVRRWQNRSNLFRQAGQPAALPSPTAPSD